jgi:hypothetical protein
MSIKSVSMGAFFLFSSQVTFAMTPKNNPMLNWQINQEVYQRTNAQQFQLRRIVIDQDTSIKPDLKKSSHKQLGFKDNGILTRFWRTVSTYTMTFFSKKPIKDYKHGEFPV